MTTLNLGTIFAALLAAVLASTVVSFPPPTTADPQLAHAVFFTLKDQSLRSRRDFIESCDKYLTGHRGTVSYTIGAMAEDVKEPVSDREFDVALHVVFEDKSMLAEYLKSERHDKFVAENKDKFAKVRVFDSYLSNPKATSAAK